MYHYLVGIRVNEKKSLMEGDLIYHLDFVFPYTERDIDNVKLTLEAIRNKLWPTTEEEAAHAFGSSGVISALNAMLIRARYNNIVVCHFYSDHDIDPEWFEIYFRTNNKEYLSKKIREAMVNI